MYPDRVPRFTRDELVEATGLPFRTIRYYVEKGLAPPALGKGPGAYYTSEHVQILTRIRELRALNMGIDEIRAELSEPEHSPEPAPPGEPWIRIRLHPDLELHIRDGTAEHVRVLARQIEALAADWLGDDTEI